MCLLCAQWQKEKMNIQEVRQALTELVVHTPGQKDDDFKHHMELFFSDDLEKELRKYGEE